MPLQVVSITRSVQATIAALPQAAPGTANLFRITGGVFVHIILGRVTTVIGGGANATKLQYVDTATSTATDLCATGDINALAAGAFLRLTTSAATAMNIASVAGFFVFPQATAATALTYWFTDGVIRISCAGADGGTGRIRWSLIYTPLSVDATIVAA